MINNFIMAEKDNKKQEFQDLTEEEILRQMEGTDVTGTKPDLNLKGNTEPEVKQKGEAPND